MLPYSDDMRSTDSIMDYAGVKNNTLVDSLTKEERNAAKLMIKNLNFDFDSHNFRNTSLQ